MGKKRQRKRFSREQEIMGLLVRQLLESQNFKCHFCKGRLRRLPNGEKSWRLTYLNDDRKLENAVLACTVCDRKHNSSRRKGPGTYRASASSERSAPLSATAQTGEAARRKPSVRPGEPTPAARKDKLEPTVGDELWNTAQRAAGAPRARTSVESPAT